MNHARPFGGSFDRDFRPPLTQILVFVVQLDGCFVQVATNARGAWRKEDDAALRHLVLSQGGPEAAKWSQVRNQKAMIPAQCMQS